MKTFTFRRGQIRTRWLLIFGVLFGLLFSSGEGIQLMPFPLSAESKVSNLNASSREESSKSYAFSVFSSRNFYALQKSKVQKDGDQFTSGEHFTPDRAETRADFYSWAAENHSEGNSLHRFPSPGSKSKRAPPAI